MDVTNITLNFWRDDGLAQQSVEVLLDSAKLASDPAAKRVVAIRTLIRHFPWELNEDERLNPMDYKGYEVPQKDGQVGAYVNVIAYWEENVSRIQAEGVVLDHVRVLQRKRKGLCGFGSLWRAGVAAGSSSFA